MSNEYSVRRQGAKTSLCLGRLYFLNLISAFALLLIAGCVSPTGPSSGDPSSPVADAPPKPSQAPECEQAKEWDAWLSKENKNLPSFCLKEGANNPWCEISSQRADLQKQYMGWRKQRLSSKPMPRSRPVRPIWGKKGIKNLDALQKASVSSILRGLAKTTRVNVKKLTDAAMESEVCSSALYLSLASAWENFLPKADFTLIGELYRRSASCNATETEEATNTRFRGGLFFYAAGDYAKAKELFEKSAEAPSSTRPRSLFWLYRAHLKLGNESKADDAIDRLEDLHPTSFHGVLALQLANRKTKVSSISRWYSTRADNAPTLNALLEATEALQACGYMPGTLALTSWAIGQLPAEANPKLLLYIAKLRENANEHPVKIAIAADALYRDPSLVAKETLELFYPRPFWEAFDAQKNLIDPYFLTAVARQESAFNPGAVSSAKAMGLLQLIPSTARRFKRRVNLRVPKENVEVGARYLNQLLKATDGKVHHTLASYNAGPGKVKQWATRYQTEDAILFVDLIPYRETRDYVAAVLRNYFWYRTLYGHTTDNSTVVAGAFPVDMEAVAVLRQSQTPAAQISSAVPKEEPVKEPVAQKTEKPVEQIPAEEKKASPEISRREKNAPLPDLDISEGSDKSVGENLDSATVTPPEEDSTNQLPDEISIAPEIDKSLPN